MYTKAAIISTILAASVRAQLAGTLTRETHPSLPAQVCTKSGGCKTVNTAVTLDSNWRWTHTTSGTNCYTGNKWDAPCSGDGKSCAAACAIDGADYAGTYGITTSGNALNLKFVTKSSGTNIGSRVYLMASDSKYQMFKLLNQEFTFDVDASQLGCGLNGALYFIEMDEDGGLAKYSGNKAGAKFGTGYCDAQCPHDIKFIAGEANNVDWKSSATDVNGGGGKYGTCCAEMDIWEANSISTAFTPHPCRDTGLYRCEGKECGDGDDRYNGVCDKDGCDFNSYRMGNTSFYGPGKIVDSTKKVTVVTQFITTDGTANGDLKEIRRKYIQNGRVIENSVNQIPGIPEQNSIDQNFCDKAKSVFGDNNHFSKLGGQKGMGASMKRGMVLALSLWADHAVHMLWLDSTYPVGSDKLGAARGTCSADSGNPKDIEANAPNSAVTYSNIRWGDLDSTYTGETSNPPPVSSSSSVRTVTTATTVRTSSTSVRTTSASATPSSPAGTVAKWGQCGGIGYNGPTACVAGSTCNKVNDWYSQCI